MIHEWPAAIFIASLIGIAHAHTAWLDRVDFAFLAKIVDLGEWLALPASPDPHAWIYTIDRDDFAVRYNGRTPLNRCELRKDLEAIYESIHDHNKGPAIDMSREGDRHPSEIAAEKEEAAALAVKVLVIDLDLSPIAPATLEEKRCQRDLDALLIQQRNKPVGTALPVKAVVMRPIGADDSVATRRWMDDMESQNIIFGDVRYPMREDTAASYYCDPQSLAAQAYSAAGGSGDNCVARTALAIKDVKCKADCEHASVEDQELIDHLRLENQEVIDPLKYGKQIDLKSIRPVDAGIARQNLSPLRSASPPPVKAVFFGVALDADSHTTPIGVLYGVQINAAAFLSLINPISSEHHLLAFAIDVIVGLLFAVVITLFWELFFEYRTARSPTRRTSAGLWLIALALGGAAMLIVITTASSYGLRHGVWISPLPVALGMLFDAAIAGSVAYVIERDGASHGPSNLMESILALFGGKVSRLFCSRHYFAAGIEALYLAVWIVVVTWGFFPHLLKGLHA